MRRGHSGFGGWRSDNPRYFRPRGGGGPPHFGPGRNYSQQEPPRFPHPGPRPPRGALLNHPRPEHLDRSNYRHVNRPHHYQQARNRDVRSTYQTQNQMRHGSNEPSQYHDSNKYYEDPQSDQYHVNSMGDIDHRQFEYPPPPKPYSNINQSMPSWSNTAENKRQYFDDRNNQKPFRHLNRHLESLESNKIPIPEYSGHRPPASDHYGGDPASTLENSNSFSRSVDDTVDIIRRRLQNRNDQPSENEIIASDIDDRITSGNETAQVSSNLINVHQNQTTKRRVQRTNTPNVETNCDKMKSKIVHELFKMDKDKIHKLMDNPSSSSKIEYALSSLITESQNSLNRHLRSAAEKSLFSSDDFVHNDSNTIYEDTFMKQMQGLLDPQDTVLLEDIKPLVLAELSKVLQLNEYDQPFQVANYDGNYQPANDQQVYDYGNYDQPEYYDQIASPAHTTQHNYQNPQVEDDRDRNIEYHHTESISPNSLFQRRISSNIELCSVPTLDYRQESVPSRDQHSNELLDNNIERNIQSMDSMERSSSIEHSFISERRYSRKSVEAKTVEESEPPLPLFDTNHEQFSEEDDPFAELDNQYHVAVDHNFIDTYGSSPSQSTSSVTQSPNIKKESYNKSEIDVNTVKKEIDQQLSTQKSPSTLGTSKITKSNLEENNALLALSNIQVKQEQIYVATDLLQETSLGCNNHGVCVDKSESFNILPKTPPPNSNSRKRSTDQKPSHRKEKRKKSDSEKSDTSKQILNKNIIINVNECAQSKDREKCKETAKSIFNFFYSKSDTKKEEPNDTKKVESVDKIYSEKYVKRKESESRTKNTSDQRKRQRSTSSSKLTVSPKENTNNNIQGSKSESKTKLQTIDMFIDKPRKVNPHQSHRKTVLSPDAHMKTPDKSKQQISLDRKLTKKHVSTQVIQKMYTKETQTFQSIKTSTRFCQTMKLKTLNRFVQTDPVIFERNRFKATDAFERMKEIDLEIQVLLQEKFKLYNSLEGTVPCPSSIQTLGMTVLNVAQVPEEQEDIVIDLDNNSADAIADDFTNIPVEELEKIAFETVEDENKRKVKKGRPHKLLEGERASSSSPTSKRKAKKSKTPNISLLEQIITNDIPLEDLISLDDLEITSAKSTKKKPHKIQSISNKKTTKKTKAVKNINEVTSYDIKECSVVIIRTNISKYLKQEDPEEQIIKSESLEFIPAEDITIITEENDIAVEEVAANELQIDMLDVSEDIVVGDNCEIKFCDSKDIERPEVPISEDIILDNSQALEPLPPENAHAESLCKMYDYSTDENLRRDSLIVTGHADAVLAIECIENDFIAACLDGNVYHFSGDGQLMNTLRGSNLAVTCLTIVKEKYGTTVYTGSLDSRIRYYDLETGLEKGPECNVLSPIQTMDRAWDTIFVGTRTGFVLQFECKNNMLIPVSTVKFSDQSILALRAMKEGPRKVLLVAARSEDVTVKDAQSGLLLRTLHGPKMTVYTLLYEDGKIYCGTSSHQIHVFDYASGGHVGAHEGGKGAVCLRATGGLLFAGCYDGCVYVYREGEPRPLAQLRGPSLMLLSLAVVGSKIIAGYKDRSLYIWKIPLSILQEMIL